MHCLVTGAAGFIGSHLVEKLVREGVSVTALDNFDPFYPRSLKEANLVTARRSRRLRLKEVDIRNRTALRRLAGKYDCIVHLAAKAGVRPSIDDPVAYHDVNVTGTQNLLEMAREWGVPHFVFASSSSVYGVNRNTPWSEEDHLLLPISPYASTKISGELLGHVYSQLYGIRFVGLRFFTVCGPRQRPDLAIRKFTERILADLPIPVFGDGSTSRDYTYVGDVADAICAALEYRASPFELINIGNNQPVTLLEMIRTIEDVLGKKARLDPQPMQPGDVPQTYADIRKASKLLGYHPRTSFRESVERFVDWMTNRSKDTESRQQSAMPAWSHETVPEARPLS